MKTYLIRRLLLFVPTFLGVSAFIFVMLHTIPGDYATALMIADEGEGAAFTQEDLDRVREKLGLSGSYPVQYARWLGNFFIGDFGTSWSTHRPVLDRMLPRILVSFELGLLAVIISVSLGLVLGVTAAVRRDTWIDYVFRSASMSLQAMPGFWLALMTIVTLVAVFHWIPPITFASIWDDPVRNISVLLLPAFLTGLRSTAEILRMTRSSVLEVLHEDYVRTAHSKGLGTRKVLYGHVLRNALLPVTTLAGIEVVLLMSGQIILEQIFNIPGIGKLFIQAVASRDYPTIQGVVMCISGIVLLANLTVDVMYAWLDPRIRYA